VLISFDAVGGQQLRRLMAQPGKLPAGGFRRIVERGFVATRSVPPTPSLTAVSHITIATGALPTATEFGSHGYWNIHPQLQAVFLAAGPGIAAERVETIGSWQIDARIARFLGIDPPRNAARWPSSHPLVG